MDGPTHRAADLSVQGIQPRRCRAWAQKTSGGAFAGRSDGYRDGLAGEEQAGTVEGRQKGGKPGKAVQGDSLQAKRLAPDRVTLWLGGQLDRGGGPRPSPFSLFFSFSPFLFLFFFSSGELRLDSHRPPDAHGRPGGLACPALTWRTGSPLPSVGRRGVGVRSGSGWDRVTPSPGWTQRPAVRWSGPPAFLPRPFQTLLYDIPRRSVSLAHGYRHVCRLDPCGYRFGAGVTLLIWTMVRTIGEDDDVSESEETPGLRRVYGDGETRPCGREYPKAPSTAPYRAGATSGPDLRRR